MKLLIAEDTRDLNRALTAVFTHEQYEVDSAYDGQEAMNFIIKNHYDAIVLDIMMPKKDGLTVLRELREMNIPTPVLLLTARAEVDDKVTGLDSGADDYLTKPFAMKELLARVRSLVRRQAASGIRELHFADVILNTESYELSAGNSVRLSNREFELMQTLMTSVGRKLDTSYLLEHVWAGEKNAGKDTVWLYISYLRGKLQAIDSRTVIIGKRGGSFYLEAE